MSKWKKLTNNQMHPNPLMAKCDHCSKTFDWRFSGAVNANKKEFCGLKCFDDYRFELKRLEDEFNSL
jgi:hypothetical protein